MQNDYSPERFYSSKHPFWKQELYSFGLPDGFSTPFRAVPLAQRDKSLLFIIAVSSAIAVATILSLLNANPLILIVSIGISTWADFYSVFHAVGYWRATIGSETWAALRTTPQSDDDLVTMLFALTQIRVRKGLLAEANARIGFVVCGGCAVAFLALFVLGSNVNVSLGNILYRLAIVVIPTMTILLFAQEPIWRTRAIIAVGIWAATRFEDPYTARIVSFGIAVAMRLVQLAVLGVIYLSIAGRIYASLNTQYTTMLSNALVSESLWGTVTIIVLYIATFYGCTWVTSLAMRRTITLLQR
jgi:hypothetical protein